MTKYIKKRCYICGKLSDVSAGGWLIAKRYDVYVGGSNKDVFICERCGMHMIKYIESQKESESNE